MRSRYIVVAALVQSDDPIHMHVQACYRRTMLPTRAPRCDALVVCQREDTYGDLC